MAERQALGDATSRLANLQANPGTASDSITENGGFRYFQKACNGTQPTAGSKRKAQDMLPAADPEDFDNAVNNMPMDKSCNQVRGMIRRFLESGEMKKGEFANAIDVSTTSITNFLGQNGTMKGAESMTYSNAWAFFKKRELAGVKAPKKAKAAATTSASSAAPPADVSSVSLPGEERSSVEVYDTCDEIRKKINAYLAKPGVTQASFCRDLTALLHTGVKIQTKQLSDFRGKKGPRMGNTSSVFYAAYVFFEKLRIAEKKPKSKHRKDMEAAWEGRGGFDREHGGHQGYWTCAGSARPYENKLGEVSFR